MFRSEPTAALQGRLFAPTAGHFHRTREWAEKMFGVASLCVFMGVLTFLFVRDDQLTEEARESLRAFFLPIYAGTLLLTIPRRGLIARALMRNWYVLLPPLVACASVLWSIAPDLSARRCVGLLLTTLFGLYLAERYSIREFLKILVTACGTIVFMSYVFVFFVPEIGINPIDDTWRGIFQQKNSLGQCMLVTIIALCLVEARTARQQVLRWSAIVFATIMLWFSGSRTPLLSLLPCLVLAMIIWSFRFGAMRGMAVSLSIALLVYALAGIAYANVENVLELIGKDATLTGRTELWAIVEPALEERPWLGYGYGAFWEATHGPSRTIWELIGWEAPNAHNGYIELVLSLGILGPAAFFALLALNFHHSCGALRNGDIVPAQWSVVVTIAVLTTALNESGAFLEQNSVFWILHVTSTVYVRRASLRAPSARGMR